MKKILYMLAGVLMCTCLSGCSLFGETITDMLSAPVLSENQSAVLTQVKQAAGSDIKLVYPEAGDHQNPIIFEDINGDGQDEAVVFYTVMDQVNVHMSICFKEDGVYRVVLDEKDLGSAIYSVEFEHVTHLSYTNIVVSWNAYDSEIRHVNLYGYSGTDFGLLLQRECLDLHIKDVDGDLFDEMVMVTQSTTGDNSMNVLVYQATEGGVALQAYTRVNSAIVQYRQLSLGAYQNGKMLMMLDGVPNTNGLCTQVILYEGGTLRTLSDVDGSSIYHKRAANDLVCSDLNGDGVPEIPRQLDSSLSDRNVEWYQVDTTGKSSYLVSSYDNLALGVRLLSTNGVPEGSTYFYLSEENEIHAKTGDGSLLYTLKRVEAYSDESDYIAQGFINVKISGEYTYYVRVEQPGTEFGLSPEKVSKNLILM